jgi:hypothetical protein
MASNGLELSDPTHLPQLFSRLARDLLQRDARRRFVLVLRFVEAESLYLDGASKMKYLAQVLLFF